MKAKDVLPWAAGFVALVSVAVIWVALQRGPSRPKPEDVVAPFDSRPARLVEPGLLVSSSKQPPDSGDGGPVEKDSASADRSGKASNGSKGEADSKDRGQRLGLSTRQDGGSGSGASLGGGAAARGGEAASADGASPAAGRREGKAGTVQQPGKTAAVPGLSKTLSPLGGPQDGDASGRRAASPRDRSAAGDGAVGGRSSAKGLFTKDNPDVFTDKSLQSAMAEIARANPGAFSNLGGAKGSQAGAQAQQNAGPTEEQLRGQAASKLAAEKAGSDPRMEQALKDFLIQGHAIAQSGAIQDPYMQGFFQFVDKQTDPKARTNSGDIPDMIVAPNQSVGGGQVLGWWNGENVAMTPAGLGQSEGGRMLVVTHEMIHVYDTGERTGNTTDGTPVGVNEYGNDGSVLTAEILAYSKMGCIVNSCK